MMILIEETTREGFSFFGVYTRVEICSLVGGAGGNACTGPARWGVIYIYTMGGFSWDL